MRASLFAALAVLISAPAFAQTCDFSVCPSGYSFSGAGTDASGNTFGVCNYCDWWGFCDHQLDYCPSGSTINASTGNCTWNICGGGTCGGSLPLCNAGESYAGSGVDASGKTYGSCQTGPSYPGGPIAHELRYCRAGFVLQTGTGQCFKPCLADLLIAATYLRDASGTWVGSVKAGSKYQICTLVKNAGNTWAGPTWVLSGGGLGVPVAPTVTKSWLSWNSYVEACLTYATAPSPGTWHVGLMVDSTFAVPELDEGNNTATATVTVTP